MVAAPVVIAEYARLATDDGMWVNSRVLIVRGCGQADGHEARKVSAMLVAQARMLSQLRKSPSWTRVAEAMARSRKLRSFLTSLPVKIWWSRALVLWRIGLTFTGLSAGLAGSPTGPVS